MNILLIEDNAALAESLRQLLTLKGHEVRWADNMLSALFAIEGYAVDIVLSDYDLGACDRRTGVEICTELRRVLSLAGREPRFVLVSGLTRGDMPDWMTFVSKGDIEGLLEVVEG